MNATLLTQLVNDWNRNNTPWAPRVVRDDVMKCMSHIAATRGCPTWEVYQSANDPQVAHWLIPWLAGRILGMNWH